MGKATHASSLGLETLWCRLVGKGVRMGLALQDAEDVAQDSILAALDAFEPERGDFGGLAFTTYRNRARNHIARVRPTVPSDEVDPPDPRGDSLQELIGRSEGEMIERVAALILRSLGAEEGRFFIELGRVLEEQGGRAVSEAARRVGLTEQQGWNLFRKIQRKAREMKVRIPDEGLEWVEEKRPKAAPPAAAAAPPLAACLPIGSSREELDSLEADDFPVRFVSEGRQPAAVVVSTEAVRRPWSGFHSFLERIGDTARRKLSGILD